MGGGWLSESLHKSDVWREGAAQGSIRAGHGQTQLSWIGIGL